MFHHHCYTVVINKNKSLKIIQSLMLIVPPNYLYYFYLKTETISLFRPVTIVSVVGVYRTGKSYLLNRLMGKTKGFPLGATLQVPNWKQVMLGDNHLLEIRLLETGFLSRFPPNLQIRCRVFKIKKKNNIFSKEIFNIFVG